MSKEITRLQTRVKVPEVQDEQFTDHIEVALDPVGAWELITSLRAALATPAPDAVQEAAIDIAAIENGGKRWHGEDHRVVAVRWEPYKPDGQRQMKAKGRWQEQVGSGDYWRWQNCDRPAALRAALAATLAASQPADPVTNAGCRQPVKVKPLVWIEGDEPDEWRAGPYDVWVELGKFQLYYWSIAMGKPHETADAARAAAQSDYEGRIIAALEPAPHVNETPKSEHGNANVLAALPAAVALAEAARIVREAINKGHNPFRLATNAAFREINCDGLVASVSRVAIALEAALRAIEEGEA